MSQTPLRELSGDAHHALREPEQRLREAYDLLEGITEGTQELIAALDLDYRYTAANSAYRREFMRVFGTEARIGVSMIDALAHLPQDRENAVALWGRAMRGERVEVTADFGDPERDRRIFKLRFYPLKNAKGEIVGAAEIATDVTGQIRADERASTILESITDGFFALSRDWRFNYVNRQAQLILDRTPDELIGKNIWQVYPGLVGSDFERCYRKAAEERIAVSVTSFYADHDRWYEIHAYPSPEGISVYFRNVTERKHAEDALREADRRKDEFLATLAHELRNPLAPMRNGLQIMRLSGGKGPAAESALGIMERQLEQMVRLIDDLLDVSRISRGKLDLRIERIELAALLAQTVETMQPQVEAHGHELLVDLGPAPLAVEADAMRLSQVFSNLLDNAVKYTDHGGQIRLTLARDGGEAAVSVSDTGVGMPPELLPRIFEMFMQIDRSSERSQSGLGIGLTLVKRLVEMHGGSVVARSEGPGKGSEFVVRLPLAAPAAGT